MNCDMNYRDVIKLAHEVAGLSTDAVQNMSSDKLHTELAGWLQTAINSENDNLRLTAVQTNTLSLGQLTMLMNNDSSEAVRAAARIQHACRDPVPSQIPAKDISQRLQRNLAQNDAHSVYLIVAEHAEGLGLDELSKIEAAGIASVRGMISDEYRRRLHVATNSLESAAQCLSDIVDAETAHRRWGWDVEAVVQDAQEALEALK